MLCFALGFCLSVKVKGVEIVEHFKMSDAADSSSQSPIPAEEMPSPSIAAKKPKPFKSAAIKKQSTKAHHPATSEMVVNAITSLKERNGSSLQAIKKFIAFTYQADAEKLAPFIKKSLKNAVASGKLIQTKGKGASGSFKLPSVAAKPSGEKKKKIVKTKPSEKKLKPTKKEKKGKKDKKKKEKSTSAAAAAPAATTNKPLPEKKKHTPSKKELKNASAPIKSATPKQKTTKPSKVASIVKAPKTKKAPSVKKVTSGGNEKKASKAAKSN